MGQSWSIGVTVRSVMPAEACNGLPSTCLSHVLLCKGFFPTMFKEAFITLALKKPGLDVKCEFISAYLELICPLKVPGTPCCLSADELSDAG